MNKKKPNIVFLFSDQHSARTLGCYGNNEVITPHLDQLAANGVCLTNAYTQNPICTPSRMSYFTGQYPHNHGYYGLMGPYPTLQNLVSYLKGYGYRTGLVGKIHTPSGWLSKDCDYVRDCCRHEHEDHHNDYHRYLEEKGLMHLSEHPIIPEWKEMKGGGQGLDARASNLSEEDTPEGWVAAESRKFLEQAGESDEPFFLFVSTGKPHQTYVPAKKFWEMYDGDKLTLPPNAENDMEGRHPDARRKKAYYKTEGRPEWVIFDPPDYESARRRVLQGYYASVTQMDDAMGEVIRKLEEMGVRENTLIVYASDHGDFAGEHGMIEKAPGIGFRCVTHIPFIWSWPGHLPENESCGSMIETVDLFPTLCSLAGLPVPSFCDGKDISETLHSVDKEVRDFCVTENVLTKSIQTKKYKLVHYPHEMTEGKDFGELYDTEADPWELSNLYFDKEYAPVVEELRLKLLNWIIRTTRFTTVNPPLPGRPPWEDDPEIYAEDGKVGFEVLEALIERKDTFYI